VRGRLFPSDADWCEWHQEPPLPGTVLVRVAVGDGGRLVLTGLRVEGVPTAELLRAIPVGRIEATANAQLSIVDDEVVPAPPVRLPEHPGRVAEAADGGWDVPDPGVAVPRPGARAPVPDSNGGGRRGRPDGFYRDVARAYLDLAQASTRPVAVLAEANGVPPTTAHRWVKEARRRGFLPPGRPGKAG
jgi:hypothetical protein